MTQWGLDTLFNPAKRHMDEEKRRLQSTREQIGDNSGGRRIDLESGKVVIRRNDDDDEDASDEGTDAAPDTRRGRRNAAKRTAAKDTPAKDTPAKDTPAKDAAKRKDAAKQEAAERPEPSAAAIRAAERRKRRPS